MPKGEAERGLMSGRYVVSRNPCKTACNDICVLADVDMSLPAWHHTPLATAPEQAPQESKTDQQNLVKAIPILPGE
jgi:hypothetical protein